MTPTVLNALADSSVGADGVQRFGAQHKHSRYGTAVGSKNVVIVAAIVVACEGKSRVLGWNCVCDGDVYRRSAFPCFFFAVRFASHPLVTNVHSRRWLDKR